jgi:hypothetical protein
MGRPVVENHPAQRAATYRVSPRRDASQRNVFVYEIAIILLQSMAI